MSKKQFLLILAFAILLIALTVWYFRLSSATSSPLTAISDSPFQSFELNSDLPREVIEEVLIEEFDDYAPNVNIREMLYETGTDVVYVRATPDSSAGNIVFAIDISAKEIVAQNSYPSGDKVASTIEELEKIVWLDTQPENETISILDIKSLTVSEFTPELQANETIIETYAGWYGADPIGTFRYKDGSIEYAVYKKNDSSEDKLDILRWESLEI